MTSDNKKTLQEQMAEVFPDDVGKERMDEELIDLVHTEFEAKYEGYNRREIEDYMRKHEEPDPYLAYEALQKEAKKGSINRDNLNDVLMAAFPEDETSSFEEDLENSLDKKTR